MRRCRLDAAGHIRPEHVRPLSVDLNRSTNRQRMAASCAKRSVGSVEAGVGRTADSRLGEGLERAHFSAATPLGAPIVVSYPGDFPAGLRWQFSMVVNSA